MTEVPTKGLNEPVPEACASGTFWVTAVLSDVVTSSNAVPSRFGTMKKPRVAAPIGVIESNGSGASSEPVTGPLTAALHERFRDRIAGIYVVREPDFHVVVRLTGDRDGGTLQYQLGTNRMRVEVRTGAQHTLAELQAILDSNREVIDRLLPTAHTRYIDERTGKIEIAVDYRDRQSLTHKRYLPGATMIGI